MERMLGLTHEATEMANYLRDLELLMATTCSDEDCIRSFNLPPRPGVETLNPTTNEILRMGTLMQRLGGEFVFDSIVARIEWEKEFPAPSDEEVQDFHRVEWKQALRICRARFIQSQIQRRFQDRRWRLLIEAHPILALDAPTYADNTDDLAAEASLRRLLTTAEMANVEEDAWELIGTTQADLDRNLALDVQITVAERVAREAEQAAAIAAADTQEATRAKWEADQRKIREEVPRLKNQVREYRKSFLEGFYIMQNHITNNHEMRRFIFYPEGPRSGELETLFLPGDIDLLSTEEDRTGSCSLTGQKFSWKHVKFVKLAICGHKFSRNGIVKWFLLDNADQWFQNDATINCPTCRTVYKLVQVDDYTRPPHERYLPLEHAWPEPLPWNHHQLAREAKENERARAKAEEMEKKEAKNQARKEEKEKAKKEAEEEAEWEVEEAAESDTRTAEAEN